MQVFIHRLYVIQGDGETQHLLRRAKGWSWQAHMYHEYCQSQTNLVKWKCEPCINVVPMEHCQAKHTSNKVEVRQMLLRDHNTQECHTAQHYTQHSTALHTAQHYTQHSTTHSAALHTAQHYTQHSTTHSTALHTAQHYTQHSTTHSAALHTAQHYTQHSTTHYKRAIQGHPNIARAPTGLTAESGLICKVYTSSRAYWNRAY